jgi:hypothetical protein
MDLGVGDFHGKSPDGGGGAQICFHIEKYHAQPDSFFHNTRIANPAGPSTVTCVVIQKKKISLKLVGLVSIPTCIQKTSHDH